MENPELGKIPELSQEEKEFEQKALEEHSEDKIRSQVVERYGLDEEVDKELIDKLVQDKVEDKKNLTKTIGQKIKYRDALQKSAPKEPPKGEKKEENPKEIPKVPENVDEIIEKKFQEKWEQKEIDSLELSDELKKEVKTYAKINGVSIGEAINSSYIKFRKEEEEKKALADKASIKFTHKSMANRDFSEIDPSKDFELSTPEGRKDFAEYKKRLKSQ